MRCVAISTFSGQRCRKAAVPGQRLCWSHLRARPERLRLVGEEDSAAEEAAEKAPASAVVETEKLFYSDILEEGALGLEVAAALRGVDDEIAVLRMLIRKVAREGDLEATRKGIDTLCRALKVQYALEGRSAEGLSGSLARVLDELGNELGMTA